MVDYRIVKDIENGQYSAHNYHKGRKYVILFEKLPFEEGSKVFKSEEFEDLCKDFLIKQGIYEKIVNYCIEGITTDGDSHKQWFLAKILKILDTETYNLIKDAHDIGKPPKGKV